MRTSKEMLRKIVEDYRDFEGVGDGSLQKERLEANMDEAEEIVNKER